MISGRGEDAFQGQSQRAPRTRETLLARLRENSDDRSWEEFYFVYWDLIFRTARSHGLDETEAEDVAQDTLVALASSLRQFQYDRSKGSFKCWLMNQTRWKVLDFHRKRKRISGLSQIDDEAEVPVDVFETHWDLEWRRSLLEMAMDRLKRSVSPHLIQIFGMCVLEGQGVSETAKKLGVSRATVYMAVFRMNKAIRQRVQELQAHNS